MATSKSPIIFIIFLFLIGVVLPVAESGQDETNQQQRDPFIIKTDVNLVAIDVTVTGEAAVSEMKAEDFVIYDNNIAQPTSYFSQDQIPVAIAMLIDNSGSILGYQHELQIAALSALQGLKPEDQVALFSFAERCMKICDLTEDRVLVANKIKDLGLMGLTNVHGALKTAALYLIKEAPHHRHAIILISDNCHCTGRANSRDDILKSAITLYDIITENWPSCSGERKKLMKIAEESGGEVMQVLGASREQALKKTISKLHSGESINLMKIGEEPGSEAMQVLGASLQQALEKTISRLRTQYILGFTPSNPGKNGSFHEIKIRFTNMDRCPKCQIKARRGYYAGVSAPLLPPAKRRLHPTDKSIP
jgi:Ca-activated chloride channel homolog